MSDNRVNEGGAENNSSDKSNGKLDEALAAFISDAENSKHHKTTFKQRICHQLKSPTGFLEVVGRIVLIVGVIINVLLWCAQLSANKISGNTYVAANRPWIKVTITPGDLMWAPGVTKEINPSASMIPHVWVENLGHAPAVNVNAVALGWLGGWKSLEDSQLSACDVAASAAQGSAYGRILFAGDKQDTSNLGAGQTGFFISQTQMNNAQNNPSEGNAAFSFIIYGCVDYTMAGDAHHFKTVFSYNVYRIVNRPGMSPAITGQFLQGQSVPSSGIFITPMAGDNYAN